MSKSSWRYDVNGNGIVLMITRPLQFIIISPNFFLTRLTYLTYKQKSNIDDTFRYKIKTITYPFPYICTEIASYVTQREYHINQLICYRVNKLEKFSWVVSSYWCYALIILFICTRHKKFIYAVLQCTHIERVHYHIKWNT